MKKTVLFTMAIFITSAAFADIRTVEELCPAVSQKSEEFKQAVLDAVFNNMLFSYSNTLDNANRGIISNKFDPKDYDVKPGSKEEAKTIKAICEIALRQFEDAYDTLEQLKKK